MSETRALSARAAAESLGVSDRTIRRAILEGKLVATKAGRSFTIDPRDLERYRSGPSAAPPTETRASLATPQLIGREHEMATLLDLLRQPDTRLLTLTGSGGVGKTSLARAVANVLSQDLANGALFVSLATIARSDDIASPFIEAADIYLGTRSPGEAIDDWLTGASILLVCDNFEHVLEAAQFVDRLVETHPGIIVLATSRNALGLPRERLFELGPLGVPAHGQVPAELRSATPAMRLFLQRAREAAPGIVPTGSDLAMSAEIVRQLDGLPLAIELAAARRNRSSIAEIATDLSGHLTTPGVHNRTAGERHLTLGNMIGWSYDLLSEDEQHGLRWLSILPAGIATDVGRLLLDARADPAHAFLLNGDLAADVHPTLEQLTEKHLLTRIAPDRWSMLETTRGFALAELDRRGERDAAMARLCAIADAMTEQFWDEEMSLRQRAWTARLGVELENLRLVLRWAEERGAWPELVRIAGNMLVFWQNRGLFVEGAEWVERGIAAMPPERAEERLLGLVSLAYHRNSMAHRESVEYAWNEALCLLETAPNARLDVILRDQLTDKLQDEGRLDEAEHQSQLALEVAERSGDPVLHALASLSLGMTIALKGENAAGRRLLEEAAAIFESVGDSRRIARVRNNLGLLASQAGELEEAMANYQLALEEYRASDERNAIAVTLSNYADVALKQGNFALALDASLESLEASRRAGANRLIAIAQLNSAIATFHLGRRDEAFSLFDAILPGLVAIGNVIILAEAFEIYGQFLVESERIPQAAVAFGGAHAIWKESGATLDVDTRAASNRAVSRAQQAIGSVEFDLYRDLGESSGSEHVLRLLRLSNVAQSPADCEGTSVLSVRELEVLRLVAEGLTDREIGDVLFVSPRTVATHVAHILDKLGVDSRTAAATMGVRQGLI